MPFFIMKDWLWEADPFIQLCNVIHLLKLKSWLLGNFQVCRNTFKGILMWNNGQKLPLTQQITKPGNSVLVPWPKMGGSGWSRLRLRFRFHTGLLTPTPIPTPLQNNYLIPIPVPIPAILTPIPVPVPTPLIYCKMIFGYDIQMQAKGVCMFFLINQLMVPTLY